MNLLHITAYHPVAGRRVDLTFPSVAAARRENPNLTDFVEVGFAHSRPATGKRR